MIQSDARTAPDNRFAYPAVGPREYHGSFDMSDKPGLVHLPGFNHCVVVEPADDEVVAYEVPDDSRTLDIIPAGVRPVQILATEAPHYERMQSAYREADDIAALGYTSVYDFQADDLLILRTGMSDKHRNEFRDRRLTPRGVAVVTQAEGTPEGIKTKGPHPARFGLLGVIASSQLVTWQRPSSFAARGVDYAVIRASVQNTLEIALLNSNLGQMTVLGITDTDATSSTYLQWFDAAHGTNFHPATAAYPDYKNLPDVADDRTERFRQALAAQRSKN